MTAVASLRAPYAVTTVREVGVRRIASVGVRVDAAPLTAYAMTSLVCREQDTYAAMRGMAVIAPQSIQYAVLGVAAMQGINAAARNAVVLG